MLYFEIQTMKLFIVPEVIFKGHSRSSVTPSFVRLPGISKCIFKQNCWYLVLFQKYGKTVIATVLLWNCQERPTKATG